MVIDADGLNALAAASLQGLPRRAATLLTPHPGEMARLLGRSTQDVQANRVGSAQRLAQVTRGVVILKGQRSVVADASGHERREPDRQSGMASGGRATCSPASPGRCWRATATPGSRAARPSTCTDAPEIWRRASAARTP
jgi:NAD(P)H-hydrate epimerase